MIDFLTKLASINFLIRIIISSIIISIGQTLFPASILEILFFFIGFFILFIPLIMAFVLDGKDLINWFKNKFK